MPDKLPVRNCLVLDQDRREGIYSSFIGKFYHFRGENDLKYFEPLSEGPIEIVYCEKGKKNNGIFFGCGIVRKAPFVDKNDPSFYFAEISDYKPFTNPVSSELLIEKFKVAEKGKSNRIIESVKVSSIPADSFDELCLDGGVEVNFSTDSHLVQVLGEQLIASERVGILELVKNSFDSGASKCKVVIEKIPNMGASPDSTNHYSEYEGPVIVIEDDGSGMSMDQLEKGWLRPASTFKTSVKEKLKFEREKAILNNKIVEYERIVETLKRENRGRIPLGEKGVGRFACNRLGRRLRLTTKTSDNDYELVLDIDWDLFLNNGHAPKNLEDVKLSLTRQSPSRDYGKSNSGTQLIIYGGRAGFAFTEKEIVEIDRTISKINSPFKRPNIKNSGFSAEFICPQLKNSVADIEHAMLEPVFTLNGIVGEDGVLDYELSFNPPVNVPLASSKIKNKKFDLIKSAKNTWRKRDSQLALNAPACGQFFIHLDIWYRTTPWIAHADNEFLSYLEENGGISIYRDGIIVFPAEWGSENDWLGLRQKQIKKSNRISYYHMIGNVELDQSNNINLIDKTDRQGLIHNQAFADLTELIKAVVYFVEIEYKGRRDEVENLIGGLEREPRKLIDATQETAKILSNMSANYDVSTDIYQLFEGLHGLGSAKDKKGKLVDLSKSIGQMENNLQKIKEIQEMLTEQAGFGLGIAVALHEITKSTSNFYFSIADILKKGKFDADKLSQLQVTSKSLESEILRLAPLRALRNETPLNFSVSKSIEYVLSVFRRSFDSLNIEFICNDEDFEIVAKFGALNQILTNILDNSCYWLDDPKNKNRKIKINISSKNRTILIADSGPGLDDSILPYLFQPGYSLKFPPSGLGLYVCKHYMNSMKKRGDIYLAHSRDKLKGYPGAQFMLDFSQVKKKQNE